MELQHLKNDCGSIKGLWIPSLHSDMTPELAKRYSRICPTMLFTSEKSYDLYFEEKTYKIFHIHGTSFSVRTRTFDDLGWNFHFLHGKAHSKDRKMHASNPITFLVMQKDFSTYSFEQKHWQASQSIGRQMADTMTEKANVMIYTRQIYSPGKQGRAWG